MYVNSFSRITVLAISLDSLLIADINSEQTLLYCSSAVGYSRALSLRIASSAASMASCASAVETVTWLGGDGAVTSKSLRRPRLVADPLPALRLLAAVRPFID